MNIDPVIAQLRRYAPAFENRVFGAAEEARARDISYPVKFPSAFVVPRADAGDENTLGIGLLQKVTEQVDVTVVIDNTPDRRGQNAATSVDGIRAAVFRAVLNWQASPLAVRGLQYVGSNFDGMDNARLWWRFTFAHEIRISDEDGYNPDGDEIEDIIVDADPVEYGE